MVPIANVTGLEAGTRYSALVSAVYVSENGQMIESAPSEPYDFETR